MTYFMVIGVLEYITFETVSKDVIIIVLLLLKTVGNARLGVSHLHSISPKTLAPQFQQIESRKRKGKPRRQKGREHQGHKTCIGSAIETLQFHAIEYGVCKIVPLRQSEVNINGTARI